MNNPGLVFGIVGGVIVYLAFLGTVIYFSVRWSRRILERKSEALRAGLAPSGAKALGTVTQGGLYRGTEVEYELGGRRVLVSSYYVSRSSIRANLRVPGGRYPWLIIFPEGMVDRVGKALGLNREVQTGDKAFDELAYLDTVDSDENVSKLMAPAGVRGAVTDLLNLGYKVQFSTRGVEAFQVVYAMKQIDGTHAAKAVEALGRLAEVAPTFPNVALVEARSAKRVIFGIAFVLSWLIGPGIAGFLTSRIDATLDSGGQAFAFLVGGGACWAVYVVGLSLVMRGRSYAFRVVLLGGIITMFSVPFGGGALILALNQLLDPSAATQHDVIVVDRHSYKGNHTLTVPTWKGGAGMLKIHVPRATYDTLKIGDQIVVQAHPGAFGWEWLERIPR
jgi:hypothetical protein